MQDTLQIANEDEFNVEEKTNDYDTKDIAVFFQKFMRSRPHLESEAHKEDKARHNLDKKISSIFVAIGIPPHIKGYQYSRCAIKACVNEPEIISAITKRLYPFVADTFKTSASKVERAIRHAIEVCWNRGRIEALNNLFNSKIFTQKNRPTNGEFIALIADKLILDM